MDAELLRLINAVTAHITIEQHRGETRIEMVYNGATHVQIVPHDHQAHTGLLYDIVQLQRYVELLRRIEKRAS